MRLSICICISIFIRICICIFFCNCSFKHSEQTEDNVGPEKIPTREDTEDRGELLNIRNYSDHYADRL